MAGDNTAATSAIPTSVKRPRTLAEKVWENHVVVPGQDGKPDLLYIDLHLLHEVTSPQAFEGLRLENRPLRRLDLNDRTEDHQYPNRNISRPLRILLREPRSKPCVVTPRNLACASIRSAILNRVSYT